MERVWIVVLTSLSLISLLLAIVGLISPNWVNYYNLHPISRGLWEICKYENCSSIPPGELFWLHYKNINVAKQKTKLKEVIYSIIANCWVCFLQFS